MNRFNKMSFNVSQLNNTKKLRKDPNLEVRLPEKENVKTKEEKKDRKRISSLVESEVEQDNSEDESNDRDSDLSDDKNSSVLEESINEDSESVEEEGSVKEDDFEAGPVGSQDETEKEKSIDQATTNGTAESTNEDLKPQESSNKDYELVVGRLSRHKHRMNPRTFREFFMNIWKKHNGISYRVSGELVLSLINMGY